MNPTASPHRGTRKIVVGQVTSDRMQQTRTVAVTELFKHPLFGKYLKRTQKFHVHDAENLSHVGDKVQIVECRPLSKTKRWRLQKILERAV